MALKLLEEFRKTQQVRLPILERESEELVLCNDEELNRNQLRIRKKFVICGAFWFEQKDFEELSS